MAPATSIGYVVLAGLYLVGAIGGLLVGCHLGEWIGKRVERPLPGIFVGAAIGGTLGCSFMYVVTRWVLPVVLGWLGGGGSS